MPACPFSRSVSVRADCHSEEPKATKNLLLRLELQPQILRSAQNDNPAIKTETSPSLRPYCAGVAAFTAPLINAIPQGTPQPVTLSQPVVTVSDESVPKLMTPY
jgi:hypothetical protein